MRGWAIGINWTHVALWRRWLMAWFGLVAFALVAGAHLGPRPDEILFAVTLPLLVIVPYAAGCLVLGAVRLFLRNLAGRDTLVVGLSANEKLGKRPRP